MRLTSIVSGACLFLLSVFAHASIVDLTITAKWLAADFDVSPVGTAPLSGLADENDDKVFGIAPSDGSTTFTLRVNTDSAVSFATGYVGTGGVITHDWYGYSDVTLIGTHTIGDATFDNTGILSGLIGVDNLARALWTDTDIATSAPGVLSFRMFGETASGLTADIFLGSRTASTISDQVLIWEYFNGEEIRNSGAQTSTDPRGTVATTNVVSEPATVLLLLVGAVAAAVRREKRRS